MNIAYSFRRKLVSVFFLYQYFVPAGNVIKLRFSRAESGSPTFKRGTVSGSPPFEAIPYPNYRFAFVHKRIREGGWKARRALMWIASGATRRWRRWYFSTLLRVEFRGYNKIEFKPREGIQPLPGLELVWLFIPLVVPVAIQIEALRANNLLCH